MDDGTDLAPPCPGDPSGPQPVDGAPLRSGKAADHEPTVFHAHTTAERVSAPPKSIEEFSVVLGRVEGAAREWGLRMDLPEGRFISALMGAIEWSGRLSDAAQAEFRAISKAHRDAAELELARAREITKATNVALLQARSAIIGLEVERENVIARMAVEVVPKLADKLQSEMSDRNRSLRERIWLRHALAASGLAVAVFLGGYGLRALGDRDATGAQAALTRCLAHTVEAKARVYCDVTELRANGQ